MNYKNLIVPGLLIILVTLIGAYVTALNIVREKELGTIEQVNVTPIKKWQFLLGKMIPFLILGLVEFAAGLLIMNLMFGIHIQGSLLLVFGLTSVYLLVMLGLGFFISSMAANQLQAMFIVFFLFILFVMLSGILTPVEGMPHWASYLNYANPMSFFMSAMKTVILKGSTVDNIQTQFIVLAVMAVVLNAAALMPKNIVRDFNGHLVTLQTPDIFQLLKVMGKYAAHCTFYPYGENLHVIFYEPLEKAIPEFEAFLQQNNINYGEIKHIEPNIEDCFIEIVKGN